MTTDELRAGAERLTTPRAKAGCFNGSDAERTRLGILVADAYLAEHLADDGEPVTPEWLKAEGWVTADPRRMRSGLRMLWNVRFRCDGYTIEILETARTKGGENLPGARHEVGRFVTLRDGGNFETVLPLNLPTRGDVRRLLKALNITT